MSLDPPCPIDVTDLKFLRQNLVKVFKSDAIPHLNSNLVAAASSHGLIFVGTPNTELRVLQLSELTKEKLDGEAVPLRTLNLPSEPFQIAVSCDHSMLAVDVVASGVPFLYIYSVPSFLSANVIKIQEIRLSSDENVRSGQICWNPVISNMLSVCCQNGSLSIYTIKDNQALEFHSLDKSEKAMCACWSPKGKQLVVGFGNGKLVQYKPDLKPARTILCPAGIILDSNDFDIVAIQWLSTYQFCAAFLPLTDETACPKIFIVDAPKSGNPSYINYDEIVYNGGSRCGQIFMEYILPWNILLIASSSSNEIGILATTGEQSGDNQTWCQWTTTDDARAELPLNEKRDDTFPLGLALETGCSHEEIVGESAVPVGAMVHLISTDGDLVSFNILNMSKNNASICSPPKPASDTTGLSQFKKIDFNKTAVIQQPSIQQPPIQQPTIQQPSTEITFAVPSGATSTPAIPTKGKSFFSPNPAESKSPINLFGEASSAMPKIQPSFGQAITFGQTKPASNQPLFGNNFSVTNTTQPITATQQPSLLKLVLSTPTSQQTKKVDDQNKPLITVPPTYNPSPIQKSDSATEIPTTAIKSANKLEQNDDNNTVINAMIAEEIQKFEKELKELLNRSKSLDINVGSKEESVQMTKSLKELQDLSDQATESTDSQASDIQTLRLGLNEGFAMLAEGNSKTSMFNNPSPNQYQETHAMSQSSRRQLTNLQNILAQNEVQLQIVNRQIDAQWAAHQESQKKSNKNRMHVPSLEVLYQTLSKEREILARQRAKLTVMKTKLGIKDSVRLVEPSAKNISLLKENIVKDSTIESLTDSMISMTLIDQVKLDSSRLTNDKKASIREAVKCVKVAKIKPKRPDRIGLNSEVVREKREARKKNIKKEREPLKPVQITASKEDMSSSHPTSLPAVVKIPEKKPLAFENKPIMIQQQTKPFPAVQSQSGFEVPKPSIFGSQNTETSKVSVESSKTISAFDPVINVKTEKENKSLPHKEAIKPVVKEVEKNVPDNKVPVIKAKEPVTNTTKEEVPMPSFSFGAPSTASIPFGSANNTQKQQLTFGVPSSNPSTSTGPVFGNQPIKPTFSFGGTSSTPTFVPATSSPALNLAKSDVKPEISKADITINPVDENKENNSSGPLPSLTNMLKNVEQKPQTGGNLFSFALTTSSTPSVSTTGNIFTMSTTKAPENKASIFGGSITPKIDDVTKVTTATLQKTISKPDMSKTLEDTATVTSFSFNEAEAELSKTELPKNELPKFGVLGFSQSTTVEPTNTSSSVPSMSSIFGTTVETVKPTPIVSAPSSITSASTTSSFSFLAASLASTTAASTTSAPTTTFSFNSFSITPTTKPEDTVVSSEPTVVPLVDSQPVPQSDATSNLFGSFSICSPNTTTKSQTPSTNIFSSSISFTDKKPETTSIFGGSTSSTVASPFGAPMDSVIPAETTPSTGGLFSSLPKPDSSVFGSTYGQSSGPIFGQSTGQAPGTSIFGGSSFTSTPATSASIFGGSSGGGSSSIFGGATTQTGATTVGGSIFGSTAFSNSNTGGSGGNIFGGSSAFGGSTFGQANSPAQGSIFGGGSANSGSSAFGQTASFGSPSGGFSSAGTIQQTGFSTPPSSAFNKPAFGGSPSFGGAPTFGGTATFGGAPAFGSAFGSPKPAFSGFTSPQSPTQTNSLFEQLGSSQSGLGFGTLANQQTQKPSEFGGSSFSSWR